MMEPGMSGRSHRVFVPQALGGDEFLRVTWHESQGIVVFSHWRAEQCLAATPVRVTDTPELTSLLVSALGHTAQSGPASTKPTPQRQTLFARMERQFTARGAAVRSWSRTRRSA